MNATTTNVPAAPPTVTCEVCHEHPGWLRVRVDRVTTGPGVATVCGPCGLALQVEGRGAPLEAAP
jgi:hypothetical protein